MKREKVSHVRPSMAAKARRASAIALFVQIGLPMLASTVASTAQAWGAEGHRLIAQMAEARLTPAAKTEVDRLLAAEGRTTLASVSMWADQVRNRSTAKWHFVNLPADDCSYSPDRDCPGGACVVAAIERHAATLRSTTAGDAARLSALKYTVHLVADVHQPLHAASRADKGGNQFQLRAFGRGINLHALWDSAMLLNRSGGSAKLQGDVMALGVFRETAVSKPSAWAQESCRIASTPAFYPEDRPISKAYLGRWDEVLLQRLQAGSARLAALLNDSLGKQ